MRWVVVQVKSQREDVAIKNLRETGFECYCPKLVKRTKRGDVQVPMFPGYIFAHVDLANMPLWRTIRSHQGVLKLLMQTCSDPGVLPLGWVEGLIERGPLVVDFEQIVNFTKGQKIRFTAGPLSGIEGKIHWTDKQRVALLIDLLGKDTIVYSTIQLIAPI